MVETQRERSGRRVTRDVEPSALRDLLDNPSRATVAFVDGDAVDLLPVRVRLSMETYLFGVPADASPDLNNREVVLVVDAGPYWFELRGVSVRGMAKRADSPGQGEGGRFVWYAIDPRRILAWDYGAIREE